jgi:two-component system, cell cycle sensor histidine kinase and response regulator CckA
LTVVRLRFQPWLRAARDGNRARGEADSEDMAKVLIVDDSPEHRAVLEQSCVPFAAVSVEGAADLQRSAKAFAASPVAMTICRMTDLAIVEANAAYYRTFETTPEESLGRTPVELGLTTDADLISLRDMLQAQGSFGGVEVSVRTQRGSSLRVVVSAELVELGGERFALSSLVDVTEQRATEAALRVSAERLRLAVQAGNVGLWDWDMQSNKVVFSREWKRQLGHDHDEIRDDFSEWEERVHPDDMPEIGERLRSYLARPVGAHEIEFRMRHKDGTWRWIYARGEAYPGPDGAPARMLGCHIDITERRLAEASLRESEERLRHAQKIESVGRLAAGIAHDFNNVLTVINGLAGLVQRALPEGAPARADLDTILRAGAHAAELTNQLLAFSRKQVLQPRVLSLNTLVEQARALLLRVLGSDIQVDVQLQSELDPVRVDPNQLQQVLLNLVVNSRDAMPEGGTLSISTRNASVGAGTPPHGAELHPGRYVVLAVQDTGTGMDAATRAQIFEPFFTTKRAGQGTGLGLSTVHGIIKQSGGEVLVESRPGAGTSFEIYLPVALDEAGETIAPPHTTVAARGAECLLVVDDNESVLRITQRILESAGFRVLVADSGHSALELLERRTEPVHLLLSDIVMHGMRGTELVERVGKRWPEIKLLLMSGYPDGAKHRRGVLESGIQLISKPFTPDQLTAKVREVLDAREP